MPNQFRRGGIMGFINSTMDDFQAIDDRRNLAEMGAQRFDAIGGEQGEYWAQALRANPRAALGMAQQYGGMAKIENSLKSSRARGQATRAATRDDIGRILFQQSPEDYAKWSQGQAHLGQGQKSQAEAESERMKSQAIWGGGAAQGESSDVSGGGMRPPSDIKMRLALASEDPAKVQAVEDRVRYGGAWKAAELDTYRRNAAAELKPLDALNKVVKRMSQLRADRPLDVLEMVNIWQKKVDEGAVVREGDVRLIQLATNSGFDSVLAMFQSMYDKDKAIPAEMGRALIDSLGDMLVTEEASLLDIAEGQERFADDQNWNITARRRALPSRLAVERARARKEGRGTASATPSAPTAESVSKMKEVTTPDGVTLRRGADGTWDQVR